MTKKEGKVLVVLSNQASRCQSRLPLYSDANNENWQDTIKVILFKKDM